MTRKRVALLVKELSFLFVLCSFAATDLSAAEFRFVPDVFGSRVVLARDGETIYEARYDGGGDFTLVRWSAADGVTEFALPKGMLIKQVSANGTVVLSSSFTNQDGIFEREVIRWTETDGFESLIDPLQDMRVAAVSADASVIVGWNGESVFAWNETTTPTDLGGLAGFDFNRAYDASDDGSVIVGSARTVTEGVTEEVGWIWNAQDGFVATEALSQIHFVSGDGSVFVGKSPGGHDARWTQEEEEAESLGVVPGTRFRGPKAISHNGVIVGLHTYLDNNDPDQPRLWGSFLWDEQHGIRDLESVLLAEHGLRIPVYADFRIVGISDDLQTLAGWWDNPLEVDLRTWIINLDRPLVDIGPMPLPGDYNDNGTVEQADLDLVLLHWGADASTVPDTWTNDLPTGTVDQDELDGVLLNWGDSTGLASASVPEPSAVLMSVAGIVGTVILRKRFLLPQVAR